MHSRPAPDTSELATQLSEIAASGIPLADGLRTVARDIPRRRVARQLEQLAEQVERGKALPEAVASTLSDSYLPGLLRTGIQAGNLAGVLTLLSEHYRQSRDLWRRVWLVFSYPMLLTAILLIVSGLIVFLVVPQMAQIYTDFDTNLPEATQQLLWMSQDGWKYFAGALGIFVVSLAFARMVGGRVGWMQLTSSIPGFGRLIHWHGIVEFCRLTELLLSQNMGLPGALELAAGGVRNALAATLAKRLASLVADGQALSDAMQQLHEIPAVVVPLIRVGEQNNDLPQALHTAADMLEGSIQLRTQLLLLVLPPVLFITIAIAAIGLVATLLLPLVSLISNLSM